MTLNYARHSADENGSGLTERPSWAARVDFGRHPIRMHNMRKGTRKVIPITGEVVPPGSLRPNPYNRFASSTPEERWESFVRECACIIAEARERTTQRPCAQESPKDCT